MNRRFRGDEQQEAFFVLQEMSTVLQYLATEIDSALTRDGELNTERLSKIARALSSSHKTLLNLTESVERVDPESGEGYRRPAG